MVCFFKKQAVANPRESVPSSFTLRPPSRLQPLPVAFPMDKLSWTSVPPRLHELFLECAGVPASATEEIPPAGSDRRYWRLAAGAKTAIGTWNPHAKENCAFIAFARHFKAQDVPVPEVYLADDAAGVYLRENLGAESLLQRLTRLRSESHGGAAGFPEAARALYRSALAGLARLQIEAGRGVDYSVCYPRPAFDEQRMMWDLCYFKYYVLKLAGVDFDEQLLEDDFRRFVDFLCAERCGFFMFRDFQSRNIMVQGDETYFIDFQGGCRGTLQYDVASLLFQAKADLPHDVRAELLDYYIDQVRQYLSVDEAAFRSYYAGYVLMRQLQTLGAYGFRGLIERRSHFLESIPFALKNIAWVLDNLPVSVELPELMRALRALPDAPKLRPILQKWEEPSSLTVLVRSFSYKKGLPSDTSGNGGGFVFDCRGLNNPGRLAPYKLLTGNDAAVGDFLREKSRVAEFLQAAQGVVEINLETYIERQFESLEVGFGCTGGQHRSVYCANEFAAYVRRKFPVVKVVLEHRELWPPLTKAMIFAAGLGTRLRPLTDDRPKALIEVNGVPLLELQILRLKALGFTEIVVSVHHFADMIIEFLAAHQNFGLTIHVSDERDVLLETGGGLLAARKYLGDGDPFFVCNVDVLTDFDPRALAKAHKRSGAIATLAVRQRETARYLCFDDNMRLCGWRNIKTEEVKGKPGDDAQLLAFSGMHVIDPRLFDRVQRQGAFSIIDLYLELMETEIITACQHDVSLWLDVGRPADIKVASRIASEIVSRDGK